MKRYNVEVDRIDENIAQRLWQDADHASVFTQPNILAALSHQVHWACN